MKTKLAIIGLMVLFAFPVTRVRAVDMQQVGIVPSLTPEMQDKSKENACDCCQKCKAAKRAIVPKEEEGQPNKDGCDDCCEHCGRVVQPAPGETPPEVIKKDVPEEILDKHER